MVQARLQLLTLIALLSSESACTAAQRRSLIRDRAPESYARASDRSKNDHSESDQYSSVPEANVPRVLCYDGNLAIACSREQAGMAHCCVNQGGVYHDAWGNVVAR